MHAGRKPKPTALKKLQGNPGHRPLPSGEPTPPPGVPSCPAHIQGEARKEWRRLTRELKSLNMLTRVDRAALAAFCQAWGHWVEALKRLENQDAVIVGVGGSPVINPNMTLAQAAVTQLLKIGAEFGFTPSSRARINIAPPPKIDNTEKFLFEGGVSKRPPVKDEETYQ